MQTQRNAPPDLCTHTDPQTHVHIHMYGDMYTDPEAKYMQTKLFPYTHPTPLPLPNEIEPRRDTCPDTLDPQT